MKKSKIFAVFMTLCLITCGASCGTDRVIIERIEEKSKITLASDIEEIPHASVAATTSSTTKATTTVSTTKPTATKPKTTTSVSTTKITTTKAKATTTVVTEKPKNEKKNSAYYNPATGFTHVGSAGILDGKTAVISIFVNSGGHSWDFSNSADEKRANELRGYLGIAVDWITEQSLIYNKNAQFVYDWSEHPELKYEATISADFYDDNDYVNWYNKSWEWIDKEIASLEIKEKFDADNVIYLMFFDSPLSNTQNNSARGHYNGMAYPYEVAWFHYGRTDNVTQPAAIAHEILHLFGAPDLYYSNNGLITEEYAEHMKKVKPNDIMYTTYEFGWKYRYDAITNEITDITAYYLGWKKSCSEVSKWKLGESQHTRYQE